MNPASRDWLKVAQQRVSGTDRAVSPLLLGTLLVSFKMPQKGIFTVTLNLLPLSAKGKGLCKAIPNYPLGRGQSSCVQDHRDMAGGEEQAVSCDPVTQPVTKYSNLDWKLHTSL